jgi:sugar lactone lactonase YvrE
MRVKKFPIYAKLGLQSGFHATLPVQERPYAPIPLPTSNILSPTVRPNYEVLTVAGRSDLVTTKRGVAGTPQPVPVWRSGFRNGRAKQALFNKPTGVVVDSQGFLFVADTLNHCIRKISRQGKVSTLAGNGERGFFDGLGLQARFNQPTGLALDASGSLFVVDSLNQAVRKVLPNGETQTLSICGQPLGGVACGPDGSVYITTELNFQKRFYIGLCRIQASGQTELLVEQMGSLCWKAYRNGDQNKPFNPWFSERADCLLPFSLSNQISRSDELLDLALDRQGVLYFVDRQRLLKIFPDGSLSLTHLRYKGENHWLTQTEKMAGLAIDEQGHVFIVDSSNHCIRKVSPDGDVTVVAGYRDTEQPWNEKDQFCKPQGISIDQLGRIFVADTGNWRVCQLIPPEAQWHKRLNQIPWFPGPPLHWQKSDAGNSVPKEGVLASVTKSIGKFLGRQRPVKEGYTEPSNALALPEKHFQDVMQHGSRTQQLASVRELVDLLRLPQGPDAHACQTLFATILYHEDTSIRTLLIREICEIVKSPEDAILWLELLEKHQEKNRILRKYLIDVLCYLGQTYLLYGHVVPLLVDFIRDAEQDVVEYAFERLMKIRNAGYESLVDPLIEELTR